MPENGDWRVFGRYYIYMAHDKDEVPWIVMLNILEKYNYSNVLHAINNLKEINNYYAKFGKEYGYYQLILISQDREKELFRMINSHTKLQRIYNNQEIKNTVVYLHDGKLNYVSSNYKHEDMEIMKRRK